MRIASRSLRMMLGLTGLFAALALGGCKNVSKEQYDLAVQEASQVRQELAAARESERLKDAQIAQMQQQLEAQRNAVAAAPPTLTFPTGDRGGGTVGSGGDVTFTLAGSVAFDSGSATLKSAAKRQLDQIASQIRSRYAGRDIRVEGHTDSTPIRKSKWSSNEALSQARADSVREYLVTKGISSGRVSAIGYGSSRPKGSAASSRRVEIVVLGN
ncbi:MAG: OmpA family protein [Planctomycetota bacterium]|nr:OmpA family protein [Planctomycetota bacterium]